MKSIISSCSDAAWRPIITSDECRNTPLTSREHLSSHAHTVTHFFSWILTVQSHIVVGEDGRFVSLGCPADHHVEHSIRGLNIMFLRKTHKHTLSHLVVHTLLSVFVRTFTPGSFLGEQKPQWFIISCVFKMWDTTHQYVYKRHIIAPAGIWDTSCFTINSQSMQQCCSLITSFTAVWQLCRVSFR